MARSVLEVVAPFPGTIVPLADVPDPVYAGGVVGPGIAVQPDLTDGALVVTAPCDGLVHALLPHAVMVVAEAGRSVLVHLGVRLETLGHVAAHAAVGDRVRTGEPLLSWSVGEADGGPDRLASPVVALQGSVSAVLAVAEAGDRVVRGQPLLFWS
ncbi:PTS glucose transporter subunit IIA [Actinotalea sp. M2MS4P-6]|uniref:PTS sugar transporter subunit IIA n=1 Tax=Actinotalea sp. M2MS4P-6 TaxID=2983762 RepID=UPI0021E3AF0D|nr:PTS glucose transporter subunit IIA [Actinotalea sp. M2MS4P-6]MCV2396217.1 PTS glucose transporter subunit IIA [Actinotalea sp. M2MS4P-6]